VATEAGPAVRVVEGVLVAAMILASPVVLWVIGRLLAPDYFVLPGRRVKVALLVIVATVALIGYLMGRYHDHFFTVKNSSSPVTTRRRTACTPNEVPDVVLMITTSGCRTTLGGVDRDRLPSPGPPAVTQPAHDAGSGPGPEPARHILSAAVDSNS
jgi:hypothetical protein